MHREKREGQAVDLEPNKPVLVLSKIPPKKDSQKDIATSLTPILDEGSFEDSPGRIGPTQSEDAPSPGGSPSSLAPRENAGGRAAGRGRGRIRVMSDLSGMHIKRDSRGSNT